LTADDQPPRRILGSFGAAASRGLQRKSIQIENFHRITQSKIGFVRRIFTTCSNANVKPTG